MLGWLKNKLGAGGQLQREMARDIRLRRRADVQARFDLAQTSDGNRKHWEAADALSAEAANSPGVRRIMRNRVRYELANSSYVKGMVGTICNDTIGSGPRLQMISASMRNNSMIEADWATWAKQIRLAKKMRQLRRARIESGECFAVIFNNPKLDGPVKLDVMIVECDRVTDVGGEYSTDPLWCDGIRYDQYENPVSYRILKYHPGGPNGWWYGPTGFEDVEAFRVFHYFKDDERPGQRRGIPELSPSIQTGAQLRRYDDATLRTAEVHARTAWAVTSDVVPDLEGTSDPELPSAMDKIELPDSAALVLPPGAKLAGLDPTQPADKHVDFVDVKLRELARCLQIPFTIAALDSSKSNLSARYLDSQIYASSICVERADLEGEFLDWLFLKHWQREYVLVKPTVPRDAKLYDHTWYWPSLNQHADPAKVASALETRLATGTASIADELAKDGQDYEETWTKEARALGVTYEEFQGLQRLKRFGTPDKKGLPVKDPNMQQPVKQPMPVSNGNGDGSKNGNGNRLQQQED